MKKLFVFFCLCAWGIGTTNGQEVVRDYTAAAAGQSVIYHGKEQVKYANSIKNHPYLKGEEYVTGDLSFEGIRYRGVKMRLDLYRNELLLLSPDNRFHIVLPSDRIDYAEFHGYHIFYRYPDGRLDNLPEGYYLRLHEGECTVLEKWSCVLSKTIKDMRSEESFSQSVKYYILKEGVYHAVRSKGSVLKVFKSKKKELARYIKQQKLDFRHAPEEAIVSVVREYERLTDKSTDELIVDRGQLTNELTVHTDTNRLSIVHHPLPTNNTVDLDIRQATLNIVFDAIERQTGCPVYRQPLETDSLVVSIHCEKGDALTALRRVLAGSPFQVSAYGGAFFVLKDNALMTSLPEDFFFREKRKEGETDEEWSGVSLMTSRKQQKATSENKVYEIGDASDKVVERATVTGNISDFKTGEPMVGVAVFVKDPMIGTTTDAYGYYTLSLPTGRHELYIQGMGMKDTRRQVMLHSDGKLDIELEEQVYTLKEVTISSEKIANVRGTTMGVERLKVKDIKNIPMAFGEVDIMKVVMALPGVKAVGEASSGFNVRGGATDQNLILFNDGTIYNPTHLFGFFSVFNPDVVKDMELYKSSIPVKYGGRISSVLDINSREGNKKEFKGSASIGLLTSRLTLEGPLFSEKTSFIVGGRTTYSDWILKKLPEKSGYKDGNAGFYDLNATINHKFDERNNLYLNGYYSHDRFRFNADERYAYENANASVKWRHIFSDRFTGVFTAGYDHYGYNTRNTDNPVNAYSLAFRIDQMYGKMDFTRYLNDKHTLDFGASSLFYGLEPGKYLPLGEESLVREDHMEKEKAVESAIYVGDRWDITPQLSLNAGIRYSLFNVLGPRAYNLYADDQLPSLSTVTGTVDKTGVFKTYHGPEFRISARYAFDGDFSVKAGFNTMRQHIHKLSNTTIMSPTDTWKLSDANIKPQTGMQVAAGLYRNFLNNTVEVSLEGYYKTMKDYLDYRNGAELMMNHHIETDVLPTKGRAYGVELMVKKTQGKLNGWVSYTYSRTQLKQSDPLIVNPVNKGDWYAADFDKPHDLKFVGNYKFTHRFSFSLNFDYSTGRPITLPVSKYHYGGGEFVYYSDRNQYRIPDFFRMDASFNIEPSHHLTLLTHSTISFGVYNLTGRKNAYSVYYISENGKLKGYKMAIFGVPIPFISYNIKF